MPKKKHFGPPKRLSRNVPSIPLRAVYVETDQHESFHTIAERMRTNPPPLQEEELDEHDDEDYDEWEMDDDAFRIAAGDHPDLHLMLEQDRLPEEFMDPGQVVWNPRLHLSLHAVIERQLVMPEMAELLELACQLESESKLSPHEIVHVFAAAMTDQIAEMSEDDNEDLDEFDLDRYFDDIPIKYQEWLEALGL